MLGLARLHAYSVKKGCYPGQEIVARTHFLGEAKRSVHRVRSARPAREGERILLGTQDMGEVVSSSGNTDHSEALALLPAKLESGPPLTFADDGVALEVLPFYSGLER
jgi:folate-binding Fe-S cluster repair protein YgfZ